MPFLFPIPNFSRKIKPFIFSDHIRIVSHEIFFKKETVPQSAVFLLLFSAGFFFQYFFPIFLPGIRMFPHPPTAVCLSFLYAGNRNISLFLRNRRKNRLPCPCKNFTPESELSVFSEFTGIFSIVSRETFFFLPCLCIHQIYRNARISFAGTGYHFPSQKIFPALLFQSDSFPYAKKIRTFFPRLCTAVLFSCIRPCRSRNPRQSPSEFF